MTRLIVGDASGKIVERLETLRREASSHKTVRSRQFEKALAALQEALQEVEAVEEALSRQNDDLIAAREQLEIERHRYRDLFEQAPDGYLVTDVMGTIDEANRAASRLFNYSSGALRGKPLSVFLDLEERADFRSLLRDLQPGTKRQDLELVLRPFGVPARTVMVSLTRDEDRPSRPARLLWILRDVSDRKATEEALRETEERLRHSQRLESIGRLAGGIAHSFNNLLAAIAFHVGLLLEELPHEDRLLRHAGEIREAGERAAALARQLLAFGRKQVLQPRRLSLNEVIAGIEPMLRRLLGEHIRLEARLSPETGAVCVDLGQLEQVILNLVLNARDAMPAGGSLRVETARHDLEEAETWRGEELPAGPYVCLKIEDAGTGMPPEVLARVFEPFFTTKERGRGSGLGLATVYGIVRQSGGAVRVESQPGQGSTFTILLPRDGDAADCEPAVAAPEPRRTTRPAGRGAEVVLLVEDEDNTREPAIDILESRGYTVLAAQDAAEARELSRSHPGPIHLLVTDMIMPGMNGGQLADHLISDRPDLRILFISGYPEDALPQDVQRSGCSFLQKPFPPGVLLAAVREALDRQG